MRTTRFVGAIVGSSLACVWLTAVPVVRADAPPSPPFTASVIVVQPSWDYDNVALAYAILPADGAPYGVGEVTGGPSCMVPPVPSYLYDDTVSGDSAVTSGPGTGRYPDDPGANYVLWESRGGAPGEYVVVARWLNYCFRPGQPAPSGDELFPQEVAHPQGEPVEVTATVAVYEAGESSPSSSTVLGGVVIAGADRPANELATELGRVVLPPTIAQGAETTEETTEAGPVGEASPVAPASADEIEGTETSAVLPDEEEASGTRDLDVVLGLVILLAIAFGVSLATVLTVLFLRSRDERRKWFTRLPEPDKPVPPVDYERMMERIMRGEPPPPPRWTHQAASTEMWDRPDPGPDDLPYSEGVEGPVIVLEQRGGWARIEWSGGSAWIPTDKLGPLPPQPPPPAPFPATARVTGAEGWGEPSPGPDARPHPDPIDGPVRVLERRGDWVWIETPSHDRYWVAAKTVTSGLR
ncbi:MAG: hypothetical protein MUE82_01095 [Chloroflexi bacterium]|nr:hypothetical protein [Chloroflexota bacterium]